MSKRLLALTALAATCAMIAGATAAQAPADPLRSASQLLHASRMMSPAKPRTRVAQDAQCSGQTKPVVACACEATDSNGTCTHEVCDTICPGNDQQDG